MTFPLTSESIQELKWLLNSQDRGHNQHLDCPWGSERNVPKGPLPLSAL